VSVIVLLATLFVIMQSASLQLIPSAVQGSYAQTRSIFRGLVHLPEFRIPGFQSSGDAVVPNVDENQMPVGQRIDRWEPYIKEASTRFSIPEKWIRTIINIESGGRTMLLGRPITSGAGAMGVMQLMSDTYKQVSARNGLGSDPHNVHDNILAGTAYLRDLYNKYGYPMLFAAYNAGPAVLEAHIFHHKRLPVETQNYVKMAVAGASNLSLTGTDLHALVKTAAARPVVAKHVTSARATKKAVHVARTVAAHKTVHVAKAAPAHRHAAKHKIA
jgi:membrane-bound lytic murein transglycosylase B